MESPWEYCDQLSQFLNNKWNLNSSYFNSDKYWRNRKNSHHRKNLSLIRLHQRPRSLVFRETTIFPCPHRCRILLRRDSRSMWATRLVFIENQLDRRFFLSDLFLVIFSTMTTQSMDPHIARIDIVIERMREQSENLRDQIRQYINNLLDDPKTYMFMPGIIAWTGAYILSGDIGISLRACIILSLPISGVILCSSGQPKKEEN